jgi:hypothetical protein
MFAFLPKHFPAPQLVALYQMQVVLGEGNRDPLRLRERYRIEVIQEVFDRSIKRYEEVVAGDVLAEGVEGDIWVRIFYELGKYLSTVKENKREFVQHFTTCIQLARARGDTETAELSQKELDKITAVS